MKQMSKVRIEAGLTRAELARRCGMSASTIGHIESGYIGRPYPTQLAKIAHALGWPLERVEELLDEASS